MLFFAAACSGNGAGMQPLLPPPANGYQLVIGPFQVPQGHEVQLCRTMKLPNDEPVAVNSIVAKKTLGSHHLILFTSDQDFPDQTFDCWGIVNFDVWSFLADIQQPDGIAWNLPEGTAFVLKPHQQVMLQSHYVNATTVQTPEDGLAFVNLSTIPMAQVSRPVGSMFTVNTNVVIPPHSSFTNHRDCVFSQHVDLIGMTGHFHARGQSFVVDGLDYFGKLGSKIYESDDWNNPPFQIWDPPLEMPYGLNFSCTYFNDTDNTIVWGSHADVQEHCNLFFHYVAHEGNTDPALTCKNGSGGW